MNTRARLSFLAIATAVAFTASEASAAMTASTALNNITTEAIQNPWVGAASGVIYPAISGCPKAGPCSGWHETYSNWADIYTWDDGSSSGQTHPVGGMILNGYNWFSAANGFLGYPTSDELNTPNSTGRYQTFQGANIYYKWGASGSYEVQGWIAAKWSTLGATQSILGFPVNNEQSYSSGPISSGRISYFENGAVIWDGIGGSWWSDTWPVLTTATTSPTTPSPWIVGRLLSNDASGHPSYEIYGCGFAAYAPVSIHANGTQGRDLLGSTNALYNGCVDWTTPFVSRYSGPSLVTLDVDDGPYYGHDAIAGLQASDAVCSFNDPGYGQRHYYRVHDSNMFTWCVAPETWSSRHGELTGGTTNGYNFTYPDDALAELVNLLGPYEGGHLTIRVNESIGGFYVSGGEIGIAGSSFDDHWGHIGIVQEIVNAYTGSFGGLWPRDWWANHKSPFPSFVNWNVLQAINLPDDSYAYDLSLQHGPGLSNNSSAYGDYDPYMVPGSTGQWDPQLMIYQRLKDVGGFAVYKNMFQYLRGDYIDLDSIKDPPSFTVQSNTVNSGVSKQTSEYVAAYLSLGYGHNLGTPAGGDVMDANGIWTLGHWNVGGRPYMYFNPGVRQDCWLEYSDGSDVVGCASANYTDSNGHLVLANTRPWTSYTVDAAHVTAIANAHCRIAATETGNPSLANAARSRLEIGDFNGALSTLGSAGACGSPCPSECGCYQNQCSAPWH